MIPVFIPVKEKKKKEEIFSCKWQLCPSTILQNKQYKHQTNAAEIASLAFIISVYFPHRKYFLFMCILYLRSAQLHGWVLIKAVLTSEVLTLSIKVLSLRDNPVQLILIACARLGSDVLHQKCDRKSQTEATRKI